MTILASTLALLSACQTTGAGTAIDKYANLLKCIDTGYAQIHRDQGYDADRLDSDISQAIGNCDTEIRSYARSVERRVEHKNAWSSLLTGVPEQLQMDAVSSAKRHMKALISEAYGS